MKEIKNLFILKNQTSFKEVRTIFVEFLEVLRKKHGGYVGLLDNLFSEIFDKLDDEVISKKLLSFFIITNQNIVRFLKT